MLDSDTAMAAQDLAHIWHPCTQMKDHEQLPIVPIKRGEGIYVYDMNGHKYIDCISSWWVNLFGHCNPTINAALESQLKELEHILLAGFTHQPIIKLSRRLCELLPPQLNKCFYADNGSSAIEVALKMSFHYHYNTASHLQKRTKFLSLTNAYHGETLGALSIGDLGLYKQTYMPLLLENITTPVPYVQSNKAAQDLKDTIIEPANLQESAYYEAELNALGAILTRYGEEICAFVLEPLVQCAGSMHIYPKGFVQKACAMCAEYGIHIIFDEIAVGFGRTGSMFALEQCGVVPDFLCLSKGITGGYMPLSVVVTSDVIYEAFYAPYEEHKAFLHSHSYTGNPLACSAANAVLDIFEQEHIIKRNATLSQAIATHWHTLQTHPKVENLRYCGMIFALDVRSTKRIAPFVMTQGLQRGILLRPLGNTIYFMPPYIITEEEAKYVVEQIDEILEML